MEVSKLSNFTFPDNNCWILSTGLNEFKAAIISSLPENLWYLNSFPNIFIAIDAWREKQITVTDVLSSEYHALQLQTSFN